MIISLADARVAGLHRYFTGVPCKRGHVSERLCSNRVCLECFKLNGRRWRAENPDKSRAQVAKWRVGNIDRVNEYAKEYRENNREKVRAANRSSRRKAPEKARDRHVKRYAEKSGELRAKSRKWKAENPEQNRRQCAEYRARKVNAPGKFSIDDIEAIYKAQRHRCAYCHERLTAESRRIDHIRALKRGGTNFRTNLQLLCHACNSKKWAKDPIDFARENGLLL